VEDLAEYGGADEMVLNKVTKKVTKACPNMLKSDQSMVTFQSKLLILKWRRRESLLTGFMKTKKLLFPWDCDTR